MGAICSSDALTPPRPPEQDDADGLRFLRYLLFTFSAFLLPVQLHAQSGALDNTFNPGTGVNSSVYSIVLQTNGQILIAGDFTSFNDVQRVNAARLNADG